MNITDKTKNAILATAFCLCVFLKCVAFNWCCFSSILISSIITDPASFFSFYIEKLIPGLLLSALLLVTKRKWWSIVILVAIDIWCVANLVYYRANGFMIDVEAILMAGNLKGFESSIFAFLKIKDIILPLLTLSYITLFPWLNNKSTSWRTSVIIISVAILYNISSCSQRFVFYLNNKEDIRFDIAGNRKEIIDIFGRTGLRVFVPFHEVALLAKPGLSTIKDSGSYTCEYTRASSLLHYALAMFVYHFNLPKQDSVDIEEAELRSTFDSSLTTPSPSRSIIMILVESFESWPLLNDQLAKAACPNLHSLTQRNTLFFSKVKSMAKHGVSGDGQMTLVSGMLPLNSGAACLLYGDNAWPGIPQMYESSVLVDPANGIWNQHEMTQRYGFKTTIDDEDGMSDEEVFQKLSTVVSSLEKPFCALAITGATHSPFKHVKDQGLDLPTGMPQYLHDYLVCLNYTDSCLGRFLNSFLSDPSMSDVDILITGDHTVFKSAMLHDFQRWEKASEYAIPTEESYCPLLIHSNKVESTHVDSLVYQMDIFPTILSMIGAESYWWKGFGIDLLNATDFTCRPFSESEALNLSDRMIRSNYFYEASK